MNEFRQFKRFLPRFWQEDGILVEVSEAPVPGRLRTQPRGSKWAVALAASAIALSSVVTSMPFSVPDANAVRRAAVTEEAAPPSGASRYTDVSPDHWTSLRDLMRNFPRTQMTDSFQDPEPLI